MINDKQIDNFPKKQSNPYKTAWIVFIAVLLMIGGGYFIFSKDNTNYQTAYQTGYSNATNQSILAIWQDIAADGCIDYPYPITENNQTTIQNLRFCYMK